MRTTLFMLLAAPWLLPIPASAQDYGTPPSPPAYGTPAPAGGIAPPAPIIAPVVPAPASAPLAAPILPLSGNPTPEQIQANCRARWKEYNDSLACFAPYRHNQRVLDVEAYKHCKVVKEPTDCLAAGMQ